MDTPLQAVLMKFTSCGQGSIELSVCRYYDFPNMNFRVGTLFLLKLLLLCVGEGERWVNTYDGMYLEVRGLLWELVLSAAGLGNQTRVLRIVWQAPTEPSCQRSNS